MVTGKTIISEDVFIELVKIAISKIDTVLIGSGQKSMLSAIAKTVTEKVAPQINVKKYDANAEKTEEAAAASVSFDIKVSIVHGQNIPQTIAKVREAVQGEVERITGYKVEKVDILVEKLVKPAEPDLPAGE